MLLKKNQTKDKDSNKQHRNNKKKNKSKSKNKQPSKSKRLKTFNSSDFQLFQSEQNNINNLSGELLFKNDVLNVKIKKKDLPISGINQDIVKPQINFNSTINNYTSVYTLISNRQKQSYKIQKNKSQKIINKSNNPPNLLKKKNVGSTVNIIPKAKSKSKISKHMKNKQKIEKLEPYECIFPSKNSFNSEIIFSTEDTRRQLKPNNQQKKLNGIKLNKTNIEKNDINMNGVQNQEQSLFDTNKILRFSIKQQYKKKNEAAIKIQKVFRGYLTRKILMKYVNNEQQRLGVLLGQYKSSGQKSKTQRSNQFFGEQIYDNSQRQPQTSKTFQDVNQQLSLQIINPADFKMMSDQKQQFQDKSDSKQQSRSQQGSLESQQEQSQSDQQIEGVYRHQQPIYSHEQISKYLQSSDQQERDFDQYAYQQNIIFQTNEEYLQSRKSSFQNQNVQPLNKRSKGRLKPSELNILSKSLNGQIQAQLIQAQNVDQREDADDQPKKCIISKRQFKMKDQHKGLCANQNQGQVQQLIKTSKINNQNQGSHKASVQQLQRQLLITNQKIEDVQKLKQNVKSPSQCCKSLTINVDNNKTEKKESYSYRSKDKSINQINLKQGVFRDNQLSMKTIEILKEQNQTRVDQLLKQKTPKNNLPHTVFDSTPESLNNQDFKHRCLLPNNYKDYTLLKDQNAIVVYEENKQKIKQFRKSKIYYFQEDYYDFNNQICNQSTNLQKQMRSVGDIKKHKKQIMNKHQNYKVNHPDYRLSDDQQLQYNASSQSFKTIQQLEKIKKQEQKKWDQIITLIKSQNNKQNSNINSQEIKHFMKQILQLSQKNKTLLNMVNLIENQDEEDRESQINKYNQKKEGQKHNLKVKYAQNLNKKQQLNKQYSNSYSYQQSIKELKQLKDSFSSLNSSRRGSITQHQITIVKPSHISRNIFQKQANNFQNEQNHHDDDNQHNHFQNSHNNQHNQDNELKKKKPSKLSFFKDLASQKYVNAHNSISFCDKDKVRQNISLMPEEKRFQSVKQNANHDIQVFLSRHVYNDNIDEMLKLREQLLQKKECQELTSLNIRLMKKQITQQMFLSQLNSLMQLFKSQKFAIDKTRTDITKGYQAAYQLMTQALYDAKKLGYKLPFSKSSQCYKKKSSNLFDGSNGINWCYNFGDVMVDQLMPQIHKLQQKKIQLKGNQTIHKDIGRQQQQNQIHQKCLELVHNNNNDVSSQLNNDSNVFISNLNISHSNHSIQSQNNRSKLIFQINNISDNQSSSDLQFTQQQLIRFRRVQQSYNSQIADLNKNVMIGGDFVKLQNQSQYEYLEENHIQLKNHKLYRQVYEIQQEQGSQNLQIYKNQQSYPQTRKLTQVQLITEKQFQFLIWEVSCQVLMKPIFSQKMLHKKRQQLFAPKKLTNQNRKDFIEQVWKILPNQTDIQKRINQNIAPLPKQLLKCMRIDFSQYDDEQCQQNQDDEEYQQVGKYQMILDQEICNKAIQNYKTNLKITKDKIDLQQKLFSTIPQIQDFQSQYKDLGQKSLNYLFQRQKFIKSKRQYSEDITWQFTNMELHCLFDSWNQILIDLNANKVGFSGIGLNQLTISMIDQNHKINIANIYQIAEQSKFKLLKILGLQDLIINQINQKYKMQICSNSKAFKNKINFDQYSWVYKQQEDEDQFIDYCQDGKWIQYSHQALSFFLQIVYLVQQDLFRQMSKQIKKLQLKALML